MADEQKTAEGADKPATDKKSTKKAPKKTTAKAATEGAEKPKRKRATKAKVVSMERKDVSHEEFHDNITGMHNGAADAPEVLEANVVEEVKEVKQLLPIFVGCQHRPMVDIMVKAAMDANIPEFDFELSVMSPELLEQSVATFHFQKLQQDEQEKLQLQRSNENMAKEARKQATELQKVMAEYLGREEGDNEFDFTATTLKQAISMVSRKEISNRALRELIDFLTLFEVLSPSGINQSYIKQRWKFTFTPFHMVENTKDLLAQVEEQLIQLEGQKAMLQKNLEIYTNNTNVASNESINNSDSGTNTEGEQPELSEAGEQQPVLSTEQ